MIGLIKSLFQMLKLDVEGINYQQRSPAGPGEVGILGYRVRNYRDAGRLGIYAGAGIGAYLGATTYGLIPGLITGAVGGLILGALGGIGIYGLYRFYKWAEQIPRRQSQPA